MTSMPASPQSAATFDACTSEPPASGSSRSRQASTLTRRRPGCARRCRPASRRRRRRRHRGCRTPCRLRVAATAAVRRASLRAGRPATACASAARPSRSRPGALRLATAHEGRRGEADRRAPDGGGDARLAARPPRCRLPGGRRPARARARARRRLRRGRRDRAPRRRRPHGRRRRLQRADGAVEAARSGDRADRTASRCGSRRWTAPASGCATGVVDWVVLVAHHRALHESRAARRRARARARARRHRVRDHAERARPTSRTRSTSTCSSPRTCVSLLRLFFARRRGARDSRATPRCTPTSRRGARAASGS